MVYLEPSTILELDLRDLHEAIFYLPDARQLPAPLFACGSANVSRASSSSVQLYVIHVVGPMNPGGAEVMLMELLRHKHPLTRMDFLVHVRKSDHDVCAAYDAEILSSGSRIFRITTPAQNGFLGYLLGFTQQMRETGKPDVIHIHLNARSGIVALASWLNRIPRIIVHSHAALTFRGSLLYRIASRIELVFSKIVFLFAATDFWGCSRAAIESLFPRWAIRLGRSTHVVNNAIGMESYVALREIDVESMRRQLGGVGAELLMVTVGRVVRHKNAALLIEVVEIIKQQGVRVRLSIVGREADAVYVAEMRQCIQDKGLCEEITWAGERSDVACVMAAADVFASPALKEGFGLVSLEAQAAGTPCVISAGFPSSVDVGMGLVEVVSDFSPLVWADAVVRAAKKKRPGYEARIRAFTDSGFVSGENTKRIEAAYRNRSFSPSTGVSR